MTSLYFIKIYEQSNRFCQNFRLKILQHFFSMERAYANVAKHTSVISSGELGLFWSSENTPVTAHVYYSSCIFLTANLQAVIRLHASRQEKKFFTASCHARRSRQRAILQPARITLHNRAKPPPAQPRAARTSGLSSLFVSKSFHAAAQSRTSA